MNLPNLNIIIGLAALVLLLPILGIPQSWDNALYFISGLIIVALAVSEKLEKRHSRPKRKTSTYEENGLYKTEEEPISESIKESEEDVREN